MTDTQIFDYFEGMTSISAVIKSIRSGDSNRKIFKIHFDEKRMLQKARELHFLKTAANDLKFELIPTVADEIDEMTSGNTHGGFVAVCSKREFPTLNDNFLTNGDFFVLIDGIEDPYNFGYSIRSLYAAGADGIVLPQRNWMESSSTVARSSAGTSELAKISISDSYDAVKLFKEKGFEIVCAGIRDSVSLYENSFDNPLLLVIGGEKRGISRKILDLADTTVRIEYAREFMGSLPSASAVSVIAFEIARQRRF